jgi:general secretion pathway protein F
VPNYRYEALSASGDVLRGDLQADDTAAAARRLQALGHMPLRVDAARSAWFRTPGGRPARPRRPARRDLALFTRELASLQHAGVPLDRSLQVISELAQEERLRCLVLGILESVRGGGALSDALEAQEGVFSRFFVSMVRAAEASGQLESGLARLAEHEERAGAMRSTVASALVYPLVVLGVAGLSLFIILAFVVPQFAQLFAESGRALPFATRLVIGISEALTDYGPAFLAFVIASAVLARMALASEAGCYNRDSILLRVPVTGELVRKLETARLCRSLATLTSSGVPLLRAVAIAGEVLSNRVLADAVALAAEGLKAGRGFAIPLAASGVFPPLALQMLKVGEETGRLNEVLERIAEVYDREAAASMQRMLSLLEPALIAGLGVLIGGIVLSLMSALSGINDLPA